MSDATRQRARRLATDAAIAVVVGIWIGWFIFVVQRIPNLFMGDYMTYAGGATRLLAGVPLYPAFQLDGPFDLGHAAWGAGYVYPPTAAVLSVPFGLLSELVGFALFTTVSGLALGIVVFEIARSQGLHGRVALGLSLLIVFSGPGIDSLLTGNVNSLAAAALGATWLAPRWSGYLAVLGALIKIYPGMGLIWAIRKRAPLTLPLSLGAAITAATLIWPGPTAWSDFFRSFSNGQPSGWVFIQPPRHILEPIVGATAAALVAYALTACLLAVALRHSHDRIAILGLALAMIAPAPDWHLHYYLIPMVGAIPWLAYRLRSWGRVGVGPILPRPSTN